MTPQCSAEASWRDFFPLRTSSETTETQPVSDFGLVLQDFLEKVWENTRPWFELAIILMFVHLFIHSFIRSFIHSNILIYFLSQQSEQMTSREETRPSRSAASSSSSPLSASHMRDKVKRETDSQNPHIHERTGGQTPIEFMHRYTGIVDLSVAYDFSAAQVNIVYLLSWFIFKSIILILHYIFYSEPTAHITFFLSFFFPVFLPFRRWILYLRFHPESLWIRLQKLKYFAC